MLGVDQVSAPGESDTRCQQGATEQPRGPLGGHRAVVVAHVHHRSGIGQHQVERGAVLLRDSLA